MPITSKALSLEVYPTIKTEKGQVFQISLGDYICVPDNPNQILEPNMLNIVPCTLPEIPIRYYKLSFLIKNGGGYLINSNSCRNLRINNVTNDLTFNFSEYQVAVHPIITSINRNNGSILGNLLEIQGQGFESSLTVTYEENICEILSKNSTYIYCQLHEIKNINYSNEMLMGFRGNRGFTQWIFNKVYNFNDREKIIKLSPNEKNNILFLNTGTISKAFTKIYKGFFKAPVSAKYRFYLSAVQNAQAFFINVSYSLNRSQLFKLCQSAAPSLEDEYFQAQEQISNWLDLSMNGFYYLEILHININKQNDQFKMAVEIENSNLSYFESFPFARPHDLQEIEIYAEFIPEILKITFNNVDTWRSSFLIEINGKNSDNIDFKLSPTALKNLFNKFFSNNISVSVNFSDFNQTLKEDYKEAINCEILLVFNETNRPDWEIIPSLNISSLRKYDNNASFEWKVEQIQQPSLPFSGNYTLSLGQNTSMPILPSRNGTELAEILRSSLFLGSPFIVTTILNDRERKKHRLEFKGNPGPIPLLQLNLESLSGGPLNAKPNGTVTRLFEGNNNIFINPITEEMLFTAHATPQIIVESDNMGAICSIDVDCSYTLLNKSQIPEVSAFINQQPLLKFNVSKLKPEDVLLIKNYNEDSIDQVFQVLIGKNQWCSNIQFFLDEKDSFLSLNCTLDETLFYSGSFSPQILYIPIGFLPNSYDASNDEAKNIEIPLVIDSIEPNNGSIMGGTLIKIQGKGFPMQASLADVAITIGGKNCENILIVGSNSITCRTPSLNLSESQINSLDESSFFQKEILIIVNDIQKSEIFEYRKNCTPEIIKILSEKTLSPIAKNTIIFEVKNLQFSSTFAIFLMNSNDSSILFCDSVTYNESSSQINCVVYPRIETVFVGYYALKILSDTQGLSLDSENDGNLFYIGCNVSSISPSIGSLLGGASISFTGGGFGLEMEIFIGEIYCLINQTAGISQNSFTCNLEATNYSINSNETIFSKEIKMLYKKKLLNELEKTPKFTFSAEYTLNASDLTSKNYSSGDQFTIKLKDFPSTLKDLKKMAILSISKGNLTNTSDVSITADSKDLKFILPTLSADVYSFNVRYDPYGYININTNALFISASCGSLSSDKGSIKGNKLSWKISSLPQNITLALKTSKDVFISLNISEIEGETIYFKVPANEEDSSQIILYEKGNLICSKKYSFAKDKTKVAKLDGIEDSFPTGFFKVTFCALTEHSNRVQDYELYNNDTQETITAVSLDPSRVVYIDVTFNLKNAVPGFYYPSLFILDNGYCDMTIASSRTYIELKPTVQTLNFTEKSSYGGGNQINITGLYFYKKPIIKICHKFCQITSNLSNTIICTIPEYRTIKLLKAYPELLKKYEEVSNEAEIFSSENMKSSSGNIKDFNDETYSLSQNDEACFIGYDFGEDLRVLIIEIGLNFYAKYNDYADFLNTYIEGSNDNNTWDVLIDIRVINENMNYYPVKNDFNSYRYIRFIDQNKKTKCAIRDFQINGIILGQDPDMTSCEIQLFFEETSQKNYLESFTTTKSIIFDMNNTVILKTASLNFIVSGESRAISIVDFENGSPVDIKIYLEDKKCIKTSSTLSCHYLHTLSDFAPKNKIPLILKNSFGNSISLNENSLYIVERWSNVNTWNSKKPILGDSILIPSDKLVLLDENPPEFKMLVVEGVLIVSNEIDLQLTVEKLLVRNKGKFIVGNKFSPHSQKFLLTLKQLKEYAFDENLEDDITRQYFSKVFAVYGGVVSLNGENRGARWCKLTQSAPKGSNFVEVDGKCKIEWKNGDQIIISPNENNQDPEKMTLSQNSINTYPKIYFTSALNKDHLCYEIENIKMCPEIGVLNSNIQIRGDPDQINTEKVGGYLMVDGFGGTINEINIKNVYFSYLGQAYNLGATALFFREVRTLFHSSVEKNSFSNCFNKGIALKSSHNIVIQENFLYEINGHGISTIHGNEAFNFINKNLIIFVKRSIVSLSYYDYYTAGMFISNPLNTITNNVVSYSKNHGYYLFFDTQPEGIYSDSICPSGLEILAFENNEAHHIENSGLAIYTWWSGWSPRKNPCEKIDINNAESDTVLKGVQIWKIKGTGIDIDTIGAVRLQGLNISECIRGNLKISQIIVNETVKNRFRDLNDSLEDLVKISGSIFIGSNTAKDQNYANSHAFLLPNSEGIVMSQIKFVNYEASVFTICDSCPDGDLGQHLRVMNIIFLNVSSKIQFDPKASSSSLIVDINGTFSENNQTSLIIYNFPHLKIDTFCNYLKNDSPQKALTCPINLEYGLVECMLFNVSKEKELKVYQLKITNIGNSSLQKSTLQVNIAEPTTINFETMTEFFMNGWRFYLLAGMNYDVRFINLTQTATNFKLKCSYWQAGYKPFFLKYSSINTKNFKINTINFQNGDNSAQALLQDDIFNETTINYYYFNEDRSILYLKLTNLLMYSKLLDCTATSCSGSCAPASYESFARLWSDKTTWGSSTIPQKGNRVYIPDKYRVIFDIEATPFLDHLIIDGQLIFDEMLSDSMLSVNALWVRKGQLLIGKSNKQFPYSAKIVIMGGQSSSYLQVNDTFNVQKAMLVSGLLFINAPKMTNTYVAYLSESTVPGKSVIMAKENLDWDLQSAILLGSSGHQTNGEEVFSLKSLDSNNTITLNSTTKFFHYGSTEPSMFDEKILEDRAKIILLSRKVQLISVNLQGSDQQNYFGGVLWVFNYNNYQGKVQLSNVEIKGFGKSYELTIDSISFPSVLDPAIKFISTEGSSYLINCSIYETSGHSISIESSKFIQLENNILYNQLLYGIKADSSNSLIIKNNIITGNIFDYRTLKNFEKISIGLYIIMKFNLDSSQYNLTLENNEVNDFYIGFSIPAKLCNNKNLIKSSKNFAFSNTKGFLFFFPDNNCSLISEEISYKNEEGMYSFFETKYLYIKNILLSDNKLSLNLNKITKQDSSFTKISNIVIVGFSKPSCDLCFFYDPNQCKDLTLLQLPVTLASGKKYPPDYSLIKEWDAINYFTNFDDKMYIESSIFMNFYNEDGGKCSGVTLFKTNPQASDYISPLILKNITKNSTKGLMFVKFDEPDPNWISPKYCGEFQCTGLKNFLIKDEDGSLLSKPGIIMPVSKTTQSFKPECQSLGTNSTYGIFCGSLNFSILLLDSLDLEKMPQSLAPVTIENQMIQFSNVLNGYQDHFYNLYSIYSYRYNRFPGIIKVNNTYNLSFAHSLPANTRIKLTAAGVNDFVKIRIKFLEANKKSLRVSFVGNKSIIENTFINNESDFSNNYNIEEGVKGSSCGKNTFDSNFKFLDIFLTGQEDCFLEISIINSVIIQMHLEESLQSFLNHYEDLNEVLANYLNISKKNIMIINLKNGSTILTLSLLGSTADVSKGNLIDEKGTLMSYVDSLKQGIVNGSLNLSSNVLALNYTLSIQEVSVINQGSLNMVNEEGICDLKKTENNTENDTNNFNNDTSTNKPTNNSNSSQNKNESNLANNTSNSDSIDKITNNTNTTNGTNKSEDDKNQTKNNEAQQNANGENEVGFGKIAVILGSILGAIIIILIIIVCFKRWRKMKANKEANFTDQDLEIVSKYYTKKN